MILLQHCRLIPELTEGFDGTMADLIIDEEKIIDICEPGSVRDFDGRIIDAEGNTVMPAFFDLHCHVYMFALGKIAEMGQQRGGVHLCRRVQLCQRIPAAGLHDAAGRWVCLQHHGEADEAAGCGAD